jgi:hypothetical protein
MEETTRTKQTHTWQYNVKIDCRKKLDPNVDWMYLAADKDPLLGSLEDCTKV